MYPICSKPWTKRPMQRNTEPSGAKYRAYDAVMATKNRLHMFQTLCLAMNRSANARKTTAIPVAPFAMAASGKDVPGRYVQNTSTR